ncbi:MAG TPA: hypothetical protein VGK19_25375 [Capsulimonadaceae bacterium]|jgi:hypothetical protein
MGKQLPIRIYLNPYLKSPPFLVGAAASVVAGAFFADLASGDSSGGLWLLAAVPLVSCLYCAYLGFPYSLRLNRAEQSYEYVVGIAPIAWRKRGHYCDFDTVFVNQSTSYSRDDDSGTGTWSTRYKVCVSWSTESRTVTLALGGDIMQSQLAAKEIAKQTGIPYGGIYDSWNKIWLEGPFRTVMSDGSDIAADVEKAAERRDEL